MSPGGLLQLLALSKKVWEQVTIDFIEGLLNCGPTFGYGIQLQLLYSLNTIPFRGTKEIKMSFSVYLPRGSTASTPAINFHLSCFLGTLQSLQGKSALRKKNSLFLPCGNSSRTARQRFKKCTASRCTASLLWNNVVFLQDPKTYTGKGENMCIASKDGYHPVVRDELVVKDDKYQKRSRENKAKYDKERLDDYYNRNYKDYFEFVEGSSKGKSEDLLSESEKGIREWLQRNKK
ncbi:hypothetical protein KFK09_004679 [Dendrobium nobile]|uniref:Uncharacterized protein n=1 Tax=Dendrobium nobile TaxID=94219 RepID=A0A8T3C136_DENNO|nr:hypothetical protein KFK09_004679 [Dendrobium nobile]